MAWLVFGSFFLLDGHASGWVWTAWIAAGLYDFLKERAVAASDHAKFVAIIQQLRSRR